MRKDLMILTRQNFMLGAFINMDKATAQRITMNGKPPETLFIRPRVNIVVTKPIPLPTKFIIV